MTTDVIFLRRLEVGEPPCGHVWQELAEHVNADGEKFQINQYFARRPEMMCGTMASENSMYREGEPALVPDDRDLADALHQAVSALSQGVFRSLHVDRPTEQEEPDIIVAPHCTKEGAYVLHEGQIARCRNAELILINDLSGEVTIA